MGPISALLKTSPSGMVMVETDMALPAPTEYYVVLFTLSPQGVRTQWDEHMDARTNSVAKSILPAES